MKTNVEAILDGAKDIIEEGKALKESMDEFSEWNSLGEIRDNFSALQAYVLKVIVTIEKLVNDLEDDLTELKSEEKLDAAVEVLDAAIELPWHLESFDGFVIKLAIQKGVDYLNNKFGKDWNLDSVQAYIAGAKEIVE